MTYNYEVVLFKNKTKKKIINKFKTHKKATLFYNKLLNDSNNVIFSKSYENGEYCKYEIALIESNSKNLQPIFIKDEMGRQIKISLDDNNKKIIRIEHYNIEEEFIEYSTKNKIDSNVLITKYLKSSGLKLISKLNNKIIVQNDEKINLFTFKNDFDSERFIDTISELFISKKRTDCMFIKDYSNSQRKYLYKLLEDNGFPKSYLQRHSTTHLLKR